MRIKNEKDKFTHAYITYADKKRKSYTVPIRDIQYKKNSKTNIRPSSATDFEKRRLYFVKWSDCDGACTADHEHFGFYPAYIHYIGESENHIQRQVENGGRLIIPNGIPSSDSEENVRPSQRQKQTSLIQNVLNKKNAEVLGKLRSHTFLSSRKSLITADSVEKEMEETEEMEGLTKHVFDFEQKLSRSPNATVSEDSMDEKKCRVRKNLFGNDARSSVQQKHMDQENDEIDVEGKCGASVNAPIAMKPTITKITSVNIDPRTVRKFRMDHHARKHAPNPKDTDISFEDRTESDPSNTNIPHGVFEEDLSVSPEIENTPLHNDLVDDDDKSCNEDEPIGTQRLPLREKKRNAGSIQGRIKKKVHRDILEALEYYKNEDANPNRRERYKVAGEKIYLGEGLEVSATVWYMIVLNKPQIFFADMLGVLWSKHSLANRCQNKVHVSTKLQGRSPMKELTPEKKRLVYKLYADYLDRKGIKGTEKLSFLLKVPYLITTKINTLRSKLYKRGP